MSSPEVVKCPGCAASLKYDPKSGMLICPYCGSSSAVPETKSTSIVELDFTEALAKQPALPVSDKVLEVSCTTCGASVLFEPPTVAGACPFCATNLIAQPRSPDALIAPQGLLPFAVEKGSASGQFRSWVSSRWFAPSALKQVARADKLEGVYLPFWTYDAMVTTDYEGRRGDYYYETETYQTEENGRTVTRTRQVRRTRWHSASGTVQNTFDDIVIPGTKAVQSKRLTDLEPWDLEKLTGYDSSYIAGFKAQRYQVPLNEGFGAAQERMQPAIEDSIRGDIGGDEQQISDMQSTYSGVTFKHILLPVWIGAYRFQQKVYQIVVNARTGEVSGERPYSAVKITLFVLMILLLVLVFIVLARQ